LRDADDLREGKVAEIHGLTLLEALKRARQRMGKQHFFIKLIPPRATFPMDMSADERAIMQRHVAYMTELFAQGKVLIFGPVLDPAHPYGMGVLEVEGECEVERMMKEDPSVSSGLNTCEVWPMRVGAAQGSSAK
jgi:uncharacterized protein